MGRGLLLGAPALSDALAARLEDAAQAADWIWRAEDPRGALPFHQLAGSSYLCQLHAALSLDVLKLTPSAHLTANEIAAAELVLEPELNPQSQQRYVWPDKAVVARAYIDQLVRGGAITAATATPVSSQCATPIAASARVSAMRAA